MSEKVVHSGVTIERRGRRWRWILRTDRGRITRSADSLDAARELLDGALRDRARARVQALAARSESVTVTELLAQWFELKAPTLAPATVRQYEIHMRVHIGSGIGMADANALKPKDLQAFYASLRWKPARESHHILRQAFAWGLVNGVLVRESNPALVARPNRRACTDHDGFYDEGTPMLPVPEKDIPKRDEIEKLLVDAERSGSSAWWLYLKLAAHTGARPGEICALQSKHLDPVAATVRIEWSADRVSGRIKRPKTPWSVRTLRLGATFFDSVRDALPTDPDTFLFPANTRAGARSPLPCWNSRSVKRRLDTALARIGLPHYTPHSFRHFAATHLLDKGQPPMQVARFLGHADDTLVRRLYGAHIVDETQWSIGEDAGRLI